MGALEPMRDRKQRRFHIQMMLFGERARFWRDAMSARITAQPELTTTALDVGQMDLAPFIVFRFYVPHVAMPVR